MKRMCSRDMGRGGGLDGALTLRRKTDNTRQLYFFALFELKVNLFESMLQNVKKGM